MPKLEMEILGNGVLDLGQILNDPFRLYRVVHEKRLRTHLLDLVAKFVLHLFRHLQYFRRRVAVLRIERPHVVRERLRFHVLADVGELLKQLLVISVCIHFVLRQSLVDAVVDRLDISHISADQRLINEEPRIYVDH